MSDAALQAQTEVRFSKTVKAGDFGLAIVGNPGAYLDSLIHLLLIPDVPASLVADVGSIQLGQARPYDVPGGILTFSNSDATKLPMAPIGTIPEFRRLFAFGATGQVVGVTASWEESTQQVRLSRPITGAIAYAKYRTTAREFVYTPQVEVFGQGSATTYGVICAHYRGTIITYEATPSTIERGLALIELYRRYSYKVTNRDGQFEKPPNYPTSGAYPDAPSFTLDVDGSTQFERVHEIGLMNERGYAWVETPNVNILEPFVDVPTYVPTISVRINALDPTKYPPEIIAKAKDFIKSRGLGTGVS
jgi:hypothetical protein